MRTRTARASQASRRHLVVCVALIIGLCASLALAGCGTSAKTSKVVKVGYLRNDLHELAYYVASQKGYYKDQGLDVREGGVFNAGPEEMSAFSAGQLDIGFVGTAPVMTFAGQGMADVKIVAQANMGGSSIIVRPGLDAPDVAALKGRTIAIPGNATVQDFLLRMALEKAGVDQSEVRIIVVKPPEMLPALASGQIDAAVAWEPYPTMAVAQGSGRVLETSEKIWSHHPCCMVIADAKFLDENPDVVKRFVAAHVKATQYIQKNQLEAGDMAHLFTGQDTAVARAAIKSIEFGFRPDIKKLEQYATFMSQAGVIKDKNAGAFVRGLVDSSFLPGSP